jgi:hypothetical protein
MAQDALPDIVQQDSQLISLKVFVSYLLNSRQRGRVTGKGELWKLEALTDDYPNGYYKHYAAFYDGRPIQGLVMVEVPREEGAEKRKICILGCKKQGKHHWLSSGECTPLLR